MGHGCHACGSPNSCECSSAAIHAAEVLAIRNVVREHEETKRAAMENRRTEMKKDAKAVLLHEWDVGKERMRLVGRANATPGYIDTLVFDQLRADSMGEPVWDKRHEITVSKGLDLRAENLLITCLMSLLPPR